MRYDNYAIRNYKENKPEVVILSARERILALRLLEKQKKGKGEAEQDEKAHDGREKSPPYKTCAGRVVDQRA